MTELVEPPTDGITRVRFEPGAGSHLAVSSWDGKVKVYDPVANKVRYTYDHQFPVLDCQFMGDRSKVLAAGLSKQMALFDFESNKETVIGQHDEPIRCVEYHSGTSLAFTGSWDKTVKAWDVRSQQLASVFPARSKVFCMDVAAEKVLVGLANKSILVFDVRNMRNPLLTKDSGLKYQLRAVKGWNDGKGFVAGSVEGRVAWEHFEKAEGKYAFRCHRVQVEGTESIYPVNAIAFHPNHGTFATGGGDGVVSMWCGQAKKRLWKLGPYHTSVASIDFSSDGSRFAAAISYTYEQEEKEVMPDNQILVRQIKDEDCKPKRK